MSSIKKRTINIFKHQTSISLEDDFWDALIEISIKLNLHVNTLIEKIDSDRDSDVGLSSSIRIFLLKYYKGRCDVKNY